MRVAMVFGVILGVAGLGEPVLAQTLKPPDAIAAPTRADAKAAPDELIALLQTKGILTEEEAGLFSQTQLLPQTRQVLAEMLLSKHLINRKEYDATLESCGDSTAPGNSTSQRAVPSIFGPGGNGEGGRFKTFSDWIASILPAGGQTTDLDFGIIQPSPPWAQADQPEHARSKAKSKGKSHKQQQKDASPATGGPNEGAPR